MLLGLSRRLWYLDPTPSPPLSLVRLACTYADDVMTPWTVRSRDRSVLCTEIRHRSKVRFSAGHGRCPHGAAITRTIYNGADSPP